MYDRNTKIIPIDIKDEMKDSYISYAMSVIVGRALPDIRDGLKPVHRRILYAMKELGLEHTKPYKKCARIVGECLGKFHPHGDVAVYDALVRMVQDFSLRYPLIDGQGNFGCFTKDTKIRLCDGRNLTFVELIKEQKEGKRHWTFTFNPQTQEIEIAEIKNPRLTRKKEKIIEISLDNGEKIRCTLDHLFMLRNGNYKEAKNLKPGDSLMPLYIKTYDGEEDLNLKDYEMVYQPIQECWEFIHHLADGWNLKYKIYAKSAGKIRHHLDFNKLNNNPDNIRRIQWKDHWGLHKEIAAEHHKNNPQYAQKLAEGRRKFWNKKENRILYARLRAERNRIMWQDPKYRNRWIKARRELWEDTQYREFMRKVSSQNLKKLWNSEQFRKLMGKLKSEELKKRWQEKDYRKLMANYMRKVSLKIWSDPKHREYISKLMKKRFESPEIRKRQSKISKRLWQEPTYRVKFPKEHFRKMAKELWEKPETKELHRKKAALQWQNTQFREKIIEAVKDANKRRIKENPDLMKILTQKAKISLKKKWQDRSYKEKVMKSKILNYVHFLLDIYQEVTPEVYEKARDDNWIPSIDKALDYFHNFHELVREAQNYNHNVVATKVLHKREDVYDLTIEPWHNFVLAAGVFVHNSVDGDAAAAMRYTEARLASISEEMLRDIDKETVDFTPNFDETLMEPTVLPAVLPNLLINGSSGIAVGMATNIPPHNLGEVADGIVKVVDDPEVGVESLMRIIKGPDFPTGGIICGVEGIKEAYRIGRGLIKLHARAAVEEQKSGKEAIIITEIPYQVNKANLIEQIAELVQEKKIEGISDLRDESDREGMRVVIELKRDVNARVILNQLYKHTQMETSFGIIMLALVGNRPRVLNLKEILDEYIKHRKTIIIRRTGFELNKAKKRAHILEGLKIALANLDKVIKTIRQSKSVADAKESLMENFKLTAEQAQAILEMQLQRLTALEREKIDQEYLGLIKNIELYESILKSEKKVLNIIKEEVLNLKKKYGNARLSEIVAEVEELEIEDLIAEEDVVITISHGGYIKRLLVSAYRRQLRGGKGVTGAELKEEDFIEHLFIASTHDYILFFTSIGKVHWVKVYDIPQAGKVAKGKAIINLLELEPNEKISAFIPVREFKADHYLVMATKNGSIKKTSLKAFSHLRKGGIIGITLEKDDELIGVELTDGTQEIFLATREGKAIRFPEEGVRDMGRQARGVRGIRLGKKDKVIAMEIVKKDATLLTVTSLGFGKRTLVEEYRSQSRGGKGIINIRVTQKNGEVVGLKIVNDKDELMVISEAGMIVRFAVKDIHVTGRPAQGVHLIRLEDKDKVSCVASLVVEEEA